MINLKSFNLEQKLQAVEDINTELQRNGRDIPKACKKLGYSDRSFLYWRGQMDPFLKLKEKLVAQEKELINLRSFKKTDAEAIHQLHNELADVKRTYEERLKVLNKECDYLQQENKKLRQKIDSEIPRLSKENNHLREELAKSDEEEMPELIEDELRKLLADYCIVLMKKEIENA